MVSELNYHRRRRWSSERSRSRLLITRTPPKYSRFSWLFIGRAGGQSGLFNDRDLLAFHRAAARGDPLKSRRARCPFASRSLDSPSHARLFSSWCQRTHKPNPLNLGLRTRTLRPRS
jgi:hypothetical protein